MLLLFSFHCTICRYSVENAYLDEKEDTCCAMGELATNCKGSFMPFLNECFKEVRKMYIDDIDV